MRQIIFDTETTGMNFNGRDKSEGHRIIEIGCVELIDRRPTERYFHRFLNPEQAIDPDAIRVHGITNERVAKEPTFAAVLPELLEYLDGADELVAAAGVTLAVGRGQDRVGVEKREEIAQEEGVGRVRLLCLGGAVPQRAQGVDRLGHLLGGDAHALGPVVEQGADDLRLGTEPVVQIPRADTGLGGDLVGGDRFDAVLGEQVAGGVQDRGAASGRALGAAWGSRGLGSGGGRGGVVGHGITVALFRVNTLKG